MVTSLPGPVPPSGLEPPLDLGPDAAGQHVDPVGELHEQRQHAGGPHAAQAGVAFGEEHAGPLPCGGNGGRHARRPAAGHEHVHLMADRDAALEQDLVARRLGRPPPIGDGTKPPMAAAATEPFKNSLRLDDMVSVPSYISFVPSATYKRLYPASLPIRN